MKRTHLDAAYHYHREISRILSRRGYCQTAIDSLCQAWCDAWSSGDFQGFHETRPSLDMSDDLFRMFNKLRHHSVAHEAGC